MINRKQSGSYLLLVVLLALFLGIGLQDRALAEDAIIHLPDGYAIKQIYTPNLAALSGLVASHDGTVYVRHLGPEGEVRVSQVNTDQRSLNRILAIPPWESATAVVGGPGSSFFIQVDSAIRQVQLDGSYTLWSSAPPTAMPEFYTRDGRMLGIGQGGTALVQMLPDGSTITLLSGLSGIYDVVAAADGTIYISDFPSGRLVRLKPDGSSDILTTIIKDNTDLAIDLAGKLYINNATGFFQVDLTTGAKTLMGAPLAPCPVVQSPALVVFDADGRTLFGSWVANALTWVDFATGDGGLLVAQPWANTPAADLGSDDALYMAVTGCGNATPTQVARFTKDGRSEIIFDDLTGIVSGFALDSSAGFYISLATETSAGIYYAASGSSTVTLVPGTNGIDSGALAIHPLTDRLFAYRGSSSPPPEQITIAEYTPTGEVLHQVQLPKAPQEFLLDFAPDGTLYAYVSEADRFASGPYVDRWIFDLDLAGGTATEVAGVVRDGCCPFGSFSVDSTGVIWWLLNPDSLLYTVTPPASAQLFGSNLPVDAAYVNRSSQGDIFLNMPEGLFRVWQPSDSERVQLVGDVVDQLLHYEALTKWQARLLKHHLHKINIALEKDEIRQAARWIESFQTLVRLYVRLGFLTETQAGLLDTAAAKYLLDLG